ncbi:hypothetical protein C1Y63_07780 [Corynebacterium sp. 13CS0277]|uniref:DUF3040 domain-containing protein n=1 Tax=Corynebacterium sp. 13CS0277 TaxID=2071994 RepID=UPI000D03AAEC|nr:DUF3040 domain-containing protein [Corynebacterium sp. 13CS0277]PRQ11145.1 hypothetical protein C1Y63_07780 [Corynebacterium sp. 13CS0277]
MALSEQEQKVLREIEAQLYADDPVFAGTIRRPAGVGAKVVALVLLGLVFLIGGMALLPTSKYFMLLSVLGFIVMFGTGIWALRGTAKEAPAQSLSAMAGRPAANPAPRPGRGRANGGLGRRMEDNFRKRFDN